MKSQSNSKSREERLSHLEEITAAGVTPLERGKDTEPGFDSDADVVNFLYADSQTVNHKHYVSVTAASFSTLAQCGSHKM